MDDTWGPTVFSLITSRSAISAFVRPSPSAENLELASRQPAGCSRVDARGPRGVRTPRSRSSAPRSRPPVVRRARRTSRAPVGDPPRRRSGAASWRRRTRSRALPPPGRCAVIAASSKAKGSATLPLLRRPRRDGAARRRSSPRPTDRRARTRDAAGPREPVRCRPRGTRPRRGRWRWPGASAELHPGSARPPRPRSGQTPGSPTPGERSRPERAAPTRRGAQRDAGGPAVVQPRPPP